jgi:UDP-3-O-[3-hydroxymyristoyl] glucosamine N-acyltransferase
VATAEQIAEWVEGKGSGATAHITRVAAAENAAPDTAVFATSPQAFTACLASQAGVILANIVISPESEDQRIVRVKDARLAFSIVADKLSEKSATGTRHVSAIIDASAVVAASSSIGPGAVIAAGVRIGEGCEIGARVVIEAGVEIGNRVRVQAGSVLGSLGFGYARRPDGSYLLFPQQGTLVIEDDVEIGANSTIDRGALGETRIGVGTKIDNLVHIGHNCRIGSNVIIAAQTGISGSSVVEDGAILGGQVGMGEHALVGPGVILGGGAGVLSNKILRGPGQVFWGRPAQPLKQYLRDLARLRKGG